MELIEIPVTGYKLVGLTLCYTTILPMETRPGTRVTTLTRISKFLICHHDFTLPFHIRL
jgi:hypothetical protein